MAQGKWIVGALAAALWLAPAAADETTGAGATTGSKGTSGTSGGEMGRGGSTDTSQGSTKGAWGTKSSAVGQITSADVRAISKLHAVNENEIAAGTWMKDHATNDRVKDFASKMVDDHTALDSDLMSFAQKSGTDLTSAPKPPEAQKEARELDQLKTMSGAQADRRYMQMMVHGHQQALKDSRSASRNAKAGGKKELSSLFDDASKKIEGHLEDATKIQKDLAQRQARMPHR